jgi:hypothetical protein
VAARAAADFRKERRSMAEPRGRTVISDQLSFLSERRSV